MSDLIGWWKNELGRVRPHSHEMARAVETIKVLEANAKTIEQLQDFCIWLTGCGYDFCQHDYFIQQRDKLLKDYKIGPFPQPPESET